MNTKHIYTKMKWSNGVSFIEEREYKMKKVLMFLAMVVVLSYTTCFAASPLEPADFNGEWQITASGGLRVFSQWEAAPSKIKIVNTKQICTLDWYYQDEAFNVYHLYCEEGEATTYGWFQFGTDGKASSGELYMVKFNNDENDTYTVSDCLINRVSPKGMQGQNKISDNDRVYFGWGFGQCTMKKAK
jgi:hypothetical protein